MFKALSGLLGASGIAGLFSLAPWIIALVGVLGAGGVWAYQGHQADVARVAQHNAEIARDNALKDLGAAAAANAVDEATIAELRQNAEDNDALIDAQQHQIDEDARVSTDAGTQLRNLQDADQDVDTYLRALIPCRLRNLTNGKPDAAGCGADEGSQEAAPKAGAVPDPAKKL